jgi:hypothetical protein
MLRLIGLGALLALGCARVVDLGVAADGAPPPPDGGACCAAGQVRGCGIPMGACIARGEQRCVDCAFTECAPVGETCDRTDDDCDGFVDEGLFEVGSGPPILDQPERRFSEVRGVEVPERGEVVVAFAVGERDRGITSAHVARLDAETGALVGELIDLPLLTADYALARDARGVMVAAAEPGEEREEGGTVALLRLEGDGLVEVFRRPTDNGEAVAGVELVAPGDGGGARLLLTLRERRLTSVVVARTFDTTNDDDPIGVASSSPYINGPLVATATGAFAFHFNLPLDSGGYGIAGGPIAGGSFDSFQSLGILSSSLGVEAGYAPSDDRVLAAVEVSGATVVYGIDPATREVEELLQLPDPDAFAVTDPGETGQLTVVTGEGVLPVATLRRVRASDGAEVPTSGLPSFERWNGQVSLTQGATRHLVFQREGGTLLARPVTCAF